MGGLRPPFLHLDGGRYDSGPQARCRAVLEAGLGGIRCLTKTRRGTKCQSAAYKHNGRCALHGGRSTGPKTQRGLQRISEANIKHGRQTKDTLAAPKHAADVGRRVVGELKRLEQQIVWVNAQLC
jgi:hypothetical protein